MRRLRFEDYEEFACYVSDEFDFLHNNDDESYDVSIIAKYDEARYIIKELMCLGYDLHSIDIHDAEWDGYKDEFIVSLAYIDGEDEIWCEPMKRDTGYLDDESKIIYIFDNCNKDVIKHCFGSLFEVYVGDKDDDEDEVDFSDDFCCGCPGCNDKRVMNDSVKYDKDEDGKVHGFTVSHSDGKSYTSYSVYTDDEMSKDEIKELLKEFSFFR